LEFVQSAAGVGGGKEMEVIFRIMSDLKALFLLSSGSFNTRALMVRVNLMFG
jgi:hypothetical protein